MKRYDPELVVRKGAVTTNHSHDCPECDGTGDLVPDSGYAMKSGHPCEKCHGDCFITIEDCDCSACTALIEDAEEKLAAEKKRRAKEERAALAEDHPRDWSGVA